MPGAGRRARIGFGPVASPPLGQVSGTVARDFIESERDRGMAAGTIRDRVQRLETWTRWMRRRGWTDRDRREIKLARLADAVPTRLESPAIAPATGSG
jgi:hypothetical protein